MKQNDYTNHNQWELRKGEGIHHPLEEGQRRMAKVFHQMVLLGTCGIRSIFLLLLIAGLVFAAVYLSMDDSSELLVEDKNSSSSSSTTTTTYEYEYENDDSTSTRDLSECNLFSGKWVYDNQSYPLYKEQECTFMSDQLACHKFGRKDLSYQHWRWQPHQCDLPRFNATALLERIRNKRMVFIGDSLNRGQWVSMVCLLESAVPPSLKSMHYKYNASLIVFKAHEYNATVEFYWEPLLVESNSDDPVHHRLPDRIVRIKAIEKHALRWTNADILVFNSYLWWRRPMMNSMWGSTNGIYKKVKMLRIYEMALNTWSDWLEIHVNRNKTKLFFVSMSPTHERAEEWGSSRGGNCYNETELIWKEGYQGVGSDPKMMQIVERTLDDLRTKRGLNVQMLNITQLSEYRKEGHPSIYRKQWDAITEEQISNPSSYADCVHWCLPGVPDVWNQLLYAYIINT